MPELLEAIRAGDSALVKKLLQSGTDVNEGVFYMTPLMLAINNDSKTIFDELIHAGADVNKTEETKCWRPLNMATKQGKLDMANVLLENGAYVNIQDTDGQTPLEMAIHAKHVDVVRLLLDAGADLSAENNPAESRGLMHIASMTGCVDMVKLLHEQGLNFETLHPEQTEPLIFHLVQHNLVEMLKAVVSFDADVSVVNSWGDTPLFRGADFRATAEAMAILLEAGADPNRQNDHGETAILRCVLNGSSEKVKLLLAWGARSDYRSPAGKTLVYFATERGYAHVVQSLMESGHNFRKERWIYEKISDNLLRNVEIILWIKDQLTKPLTLREMCRFVIRIHTVGDKNANFQKLTLPKSLKEFLL